MVSATQDWLGKTRLQLLIGLFIGTGFASTALQVAFPQADWLLSAQVGLLLAFLLSAFVIVTGVMNPVRQKRMAFMILPALAAVAVGLVFPPLFRLLVGGALGWLLVSQMILRDTEAREYKLAVKALRKNDYPKAIGLMTELIEREPETAEHYVFRAQLYRLSNNASAAKADYEQALKLDTESAGGANGLSEIYLQEGDLATARTYAEQAYQRSQKDWVAVYNLGMIAERQKDDPAAVKYLRAALELKIPDSRHRLLTHLWLARSYYRQKQRPQADSHAEELRKEKKGLREWGIILESEEAVQLRKVFQQDVRLAQKLMDGKSVKDVLGKAG